MIVTLVSWVLLGLVTGAVARALMPGRYGMGATTALAAIASVAGGAIGNLATQHPVLAPDPAGFIGSFAGALLVFFLVKLAAGREASRDR